MSWVLKVCLVFHHIPFSFKSSWEVLTNLSCLMSTWTFRVSDFYPQMIKTYKQGHNYIKRKSKRRNGFFNLWHLIFHVQKYLQYSCGTFLLCKYWLLNNRRFSTCWIHFANVKRPITQLWRHIVQYVEWRWDTGTKGHSPQRTHRSAPAFPHRWRRLQNVNKGQSRQSLTDTGGKRQPSNGLCNKQI